MSALQVVLMDRDEARQCANDIKEGIISVRQKMLELDEREGWRALGYGSLIECGEKEFGFKKSQTYDLVTAAKVERNLSLPAGGNSAIAEKPIATKTLLKAAALPPAQQQQAYQTAVQSSPSGRPTATQVELAVTQTAVAAIPEKYGRHMEGLPDDAKAAVWKWAIGLWKDGNIPLARFMDKVKVERGKLGGAGVGVAGVDVATAVKETKAVGLAVTTTVEDTAVSLFAPAICLDHGLPYGVYTAGDGGWFLRCSACDDGEAVGVCEC